MSRVTESAQRDFTVRAIAGTHTVLLMFNCPETRRHGLLGFSLQQEERSPKPWGPYFTRSNKVFKSIIPNPKAVLHPADPKKAKKLYTEQFPIQGFVWGVYTCDPDTEYRFTVMPRYGAPAALTTDPRDQVVLTIRTEPQFDGKNGVWFNRGAIASQHFAEAFGNHAPQDTSNLADPEVQWLSRGLAEACLDFINSTPASDGLRVAAYEFTYPPILKALKGAHDRGVDVQIVYHKTPANEKAMGTHGLPIDHGYTHKRTKPKTPHNKFIVRLKDKTTPVEVWTGSTNFTDSGFLGQTNVGHRVADPTTAKQYLAYWDLLKPDPTRAPEVKALATLTPDPPAAIPPRSIARLFSPRASDVMLSYYGQRMVDAASAMMFTAPFGVSPQLVPSIGKKRDAMRYVLLESDAKAPVRKQLTSSDPYRVLLSYGSWLGMTYRQDPKTKRWVPKAGQSGNALDQWFLHEEHYRTQGNVFFVHTKFLLVDPLSDDPLVISGSANFSSNSLVSNDENMLLIRSDTRVADIYLTEFDRIFRHFYFRDVANKLAGAKNASDQKAAFLDETDAWTDPYFLPGHINANRRAMPFAHPATTWSDSAAKDSLPHASPKKPKASGGAGAKAKNKSRKGKGKKTSPKKRAASKKAPKKRVRKKR